MLSIERAVVTCSMTFGENSDRQHFIIARNSERHLAFPDICRTRSGQLLIVYRDGAEHVDPSGKIMLVRGKYSQSKLQFEPPQCIVDTDLDDRDPSIVELKNGTLLLNFFRLNRETGELFLAISFSSDNGLNWCSPREIHISGFSGGLATSDAVVEMPNGDLVMAVYGKEDDGHQGSYLIRSEDGGITWSNVTALGLSRAPIFEEPAIGRNPDGRLIACLRTDNRGMGYIYQTESLDQGNTWSIPRKLNLWGYPADLLVLTNGGVLVSYGYRQFPTGIRYCLSQDGRSWSVSKEQILRADGHDGGELGYPSSAELEPGLILTVYYYTAKDEDGMPFIVGTFFQLPKK